MMYLSLVAGNEMAERMAYFGLSVNMVAFMFYVMHRPFSSSSNAVNNFLGISQASSVLGGFLADAYLGRYWTIAIFTTIYLAVWPLSLSSASNMSHGFSFIRVFKYLYIKQ